MLVRLVDTPPKPPAHRRRASKNVFPPGMKPAPLVESQCLRFSGAGREHRVQTSWLHPQQHGEPMSELTLDQLINGVGHEYRQTAEDMRKALAAERARWNLEVVRAREDGQRKQYEQDIEDRAKAILLLTKLREIAHHCFTFPGVSAAMPPLEKQELVVALAEAEVYLDTQPRRLP
jgi:hypothetical protein